VKKALFLLATSMVLSCALAPTAIAHEDEDHGDHHQEQIVGQGSPPDTTGRGGEHAGPSTALVAGTFLFGATFVGAVVFALRRT
jgi:hypothetical protein